MCCHFHILRFICLSSMWVNMTFWTMLSCCRIPPDAVRGSSCHNDHSVSCIRCDIVGTRRSLKNSGSHIDASHSRQPLVKRRKIGALWSERCDTIMLDDVWASESSYLHHGVWADDICHWEQNYDEPRNMLRSSNRCVDWHTYNEYCYPKGCAAPG